MSAVQYFPSPTGHLPIRICSATTARSVGFPFTFSWAISASLGPSRLSSSRSSSFVMVSPHPVSFLNQFKCFLHHPFPSISVSVFPLPPLEGTVFGIQSFVHFIKLMYPSQFAFDSQAPCGAPCFPRSHCSSLSFLLSSSIDSLISSIFPSMLQ